MRLLHYLWECRRRDERATKLWIVIEPLGAPKVRHQRLVWHTNERCQLPLPWFTDPKMSAKTFSVDIWQKSDVYYGKISYFSHISANLNARKNWVHINSGYSHSVYHFNYYFIRIHLPSDWEVPASPPLAHWPENVCKGVFSQYLIEKWRILRKNTVFFTYFS